MTTTADVAPYLLIGMTISVNRPSEKLYVAGIISKIEQETVKNYATDKFEIRTSVQLQGWGYATNPLLPDDEVTILDNPHQGKKL